MNKMLTAVLNNKSPYQLLYGELPDIDYLKFFGSLCYVSTLSNHRGKFDERASKCAFLGDKLGAKGYIAYDLINRSILVSRHVTFTEHILPCISQEKAATMLNGRMLKLVQTPQIISHIKIQ